VLAGLAACGPKPRTEVQKTEQGGETAPGRAYVAPPSLLSAARTSGGRIALSGAAAPGSRVRLATPAGAVVFADVDAKGAWHAVAPASPDVRLFGLSMTDKDRTVQAEGYIALMPDGAAAQLRAGAGAIAFGQATRDLRIAAVDFDRQGAAVVSGMGSPGAAITVRADGIQRGQASVDADGRFTLPLTDPLTPGDHQLEATDTDHKVTATATLSPAPPLAHGPFRAAKSATGWRIDWLTPGGGVQTTLLIQTAEPMI
jgi:hypothetical protein